MSYVEKDTSGCWIWQGGFRGKGYPAFWAGATQRAHRVIYAWTHGETPGELHHTCENRACVNPDHLTVVQGGENHHRGPYLNFCTHGHEFTPENTYLDAGGWRQCRECAREKTRRYREANRERINAERRANRVRVVYDPKPCSTPGCSGTYLPVRSTKLPFCDACGRERQREMNREKQRRFRAR